MAAARAACARASSAKRPADRPPVTDDPDPSPPCPDCGTAGHEPCAPDCPSRESPAPDALDREERDAWERLCAYRAAECDRLRRRPSLAVMERRRRQHRPGRA